MWWPDPKFRLVTRFDVQPIFSISVARNDFWVIFGALLAKLDGKIKDFVTLIQSNHRKVISFSFWESICSELDRKIENLARFLQYKYQN